MNIFRVAPAMGAEAYKSYVIEGRRRPARCGEVGCPRYERGWLTRVDESTELGGRQAAYIRVMSDRRFREYREGELTCFEFYPGQQCFEQHFVSLDDDPRYLVRGGDWRGNPRGDETIRHRNFDDWANDFGDHQERLRRAQA